MAVIINLLQVAVEEVRRLQRFGVTAGELDRYRQALLRDSEQAAEQADSVPSSDTLDFIMESLALGHTVITQREARHPQAASIAHSARADGSLPACSLPANSSGLLMLETPLRPFLLLVPLLHLPSTASVLGPGLYSMAQMLHVSPAHEASTDGPTLQACPL